MSAIDNSSSKTWMYLERRSHPWRKQLYVKGSKMRPFIIYSDMIANQQTPEEAADNWDLAIDAIYEVMEYCQENDGLLKCEAKEEERLLAEKGVKV